MPAAALRKYFQFAAGRSRLISHHANSLYKQRLANQWQTLTTEAALNPQPHRRLTQAWPQQRGT